MIGDLHNHTTASDGNLAVEDVVNKAIKRGINCIAITDHDTVNALIECDKMVFGKGIKIVYGVELSTRHNNESIHILGYFKESNYHQKELLDFLEERKIEREQRTLKVIALLKEHYNIEITYDDVKAYASNAIARPHIAKAIIAKGYPYSKDYIFKNFISEGKKAYVPSTYTSTKEGIELLKRNNCIAIVAHPVLIKNTSCQELINWGVDGFEAIYPANTNADTNYFKEVCRVNNLIYTAGSDFHGFMDTNHKDMGTCYLNDEELKIFFKKIGV